MEGSDTRIHDSGDTDIQALLKHGNGSARKATVATVEQWDIMKGSILAYSFLPMSILQYKQTISKKINSGVMLLLPCMVK